MHLFDNLDSGNGYKVRLLLALAVDCWSAHWRWKTCLSIQTISACIATNN